MRLFMVLGMLIIPSNVLAQQVLLDISNIQSGDYLLSMSENKVISLKKVRVINSGDTPSTPDDDNGGGDVSVKQQVSTILAAVGDNETREELALRWTAVTQLASQGVLSTPGQLRDAIVGTHNQLLGEIPTSSRTKWSAALQSLLKIVQEQELKIVEKETRPWTMDEAVKVFKQITEAIVGDPNARRKRVDWGRLFETVTKIIALLRELDILPAEGGNVSANQPVAKPVVKPARLQRASSSVPRRLERISELPTTSQLRQSYQLQQSQRRVIQ